jgi:hypothetical protein
MLHLTTLSVVQTTYVSYNDLCLINNVERIWKEMAVAYLRVLIHFPAVTEDSMYSCGDLNGTFEIRKRKTDRSPMTLVKQKTSDAACENLFKNQRKEFLTGLHQIQPIFKNSCKELNKITPNMLQK